ncbi:MAG: diguanylate cyclase [Clostridium sp.]|jgi:putative two-component system response regulator|nr:diguanylate cyclase [Clostridium sp.]
MKKEKQLILIVDDQEMNRALLSDMLEDKYRIMEAADGEEALETMRKYPMDIACVLLDVRMPKLNGFEVLGKMKEERLLDLMPVVIISNDDSMEAVEQSYALGAADYINRPFNNYIVQKRVENTIFLYRKTKNLLELVAEQVEENEKSNANMITALSAIVEFRNGESGNHVLQIRVITEILLEYIMTRYPNYKLDYSAIANISNASSLHDIGKISVPEEVLNKPGKLTKEEFEIMKKHSAAGSEMLDKMKNVVDHNVIFDYAWQICRWHHERWDGRGYPDGLVGEQIPICAQVVALADVYDALTSERVYKPAYTHERSLEMILGGECGTFNPDLLVALREVADELPDKIRQNSRKQDKLFDTHEISNEMLIKKGSVADRTVSIIEDERTKYQFLADLTNEIIIDYDVEVDTITFSETGVKELGMPASIEKFTQNLHLITLLPELILNRLLDKVTNSTPVYPIVREQVELTTATGDSVWYEIILRSMWSQDIVPRMKGVIGKLVNIQEQRIELLRLESQDVRDSLTNLFNHSAAQKMMQVYMDKSRKIKMGACLYLDFDNFKQLNDCSGRSNADQVLCNFAQIISSNIRSDDIAARIGGDEFMIFLKDISNDTVVTRQLHRLFQALQAALNEQNCSISVGVSLFPKDGTDVKTLEDKADRALYRAKTLGKNQYYIYESES